MSEKTPNMYNTEAAFSTPAVFSPECGTLPGEGGMSIRTWLAGQAVSGLSATEGWGSDMEEAIARVAVKIADATIEELGL